MRNSIRHREIVSQFCEKCGTQVYTGKCCPYCGYNDNHKEFQDSHVLTDKKKKKRDQKKTDPEKQMDLFNGE